MAEQQKVSFIYERNKNAITFPTTGVYGGGTPDNMGISVHFFVEHVSIPHSTTYTMTEKGIDPSSEENISRGDIIREIQATTIISPEIAMVIGNWLIKNAEDVINRRKGK